MPKALERVFTVADSDALAWDDPAQVFDFSEGVRVVLTIEQGDEFAERDLAAGRQLLHVAAGAVMPHHPPLEPRHLPLIVWLIRRMMPAHDFEPLHQMVSNGLAHLMFAAPPGAGEPLPPEPEPVAPPAPTRDGPVFRVPSRRAPHEVEVTIPPGLLAGITTEKPSVRELGGGE